jgi:hypothetical protein
MQSSQELFLKLFKIFKPREYHSIFFGQQR